MTPYLRCHQALSGQNVGIDFHLNLGHVVAGFSGAFRAAQKKRAPGVQVAVLDLPALAVHVSCAGCAQNSHYPGLDRLCQSLP